MLGPAAQGEVPRGHACELLLAVRARSDIDARRTDTRHPELPQHHDLTPVNDNTRLAVVMAEFGEDARCSTHLIVADAGDPSQRWRCINIRPRCLPARAVIGSADGVEG